LRAKYGEKIRKYLKENVTIKKVIDFNGIKVFVGATVDTLLYVIIKDKPKEEHSIFYNNPEDLNAIERNGYYVKQKDLTDDVWNFVNEEEKEIKAWIEKVGTPLKNLNLKIYRGVLTGFNDAFIIDDETRKKLIEEDQKSNEIIYPILVGKDVHRYYTKWPMSYLILSKNRMKVDKEYPAVFEHLKKYRKQLEERWDKGFYWFNLRECTYYEDFLKPKLIWREISHNNSRFYYDNSGFYTDATAYIAVLSDSNINLKFILTLLNSKFLYKIAKNFYFVSLTEDTIRFRKHEVEKLPVRLSTSYIERLPHLADYMLFLNAMEERRNKEKEIIDFIDKEVIDSLVYELYFKEKFYQDKLYAQPKEYLLDLISKYLKPINYDRWAEIYYKKMLEGEISKKEEEELKELEKKNSETIREVIEKIKNDKKIIEQIEKIKNHRRVKIIEGGKK
jgi:hypothetical protein